MLRNIQSLFEEGCNENKVSEVQDEKNISYRC